MKYGDLCIENGTEGYEKVLRIERTTGTEVRAHPVGGGPLMSMPRDRFEATHRILDDEEIEEMLRTYRAIEVTGDWMEGASLRAWDNGRLWNGWRQPLFERDEILRGIAEGSLSNVRILKSLDACVALMSQEGPEGESFDKVPDLEARVQEAIENGLNEIDVDEDTRLEIYPGKDVETPEGVLRLYPIGDGWCWSTAQDPEPSPAPR